MMHIKLLLICIRIFSIFLLDRRDELLHGISLPMPNQQQWMLCCRLGGLVNICIYMYTCVFVCTVTYALRK